MKTFNQFMAEATDFNESIARRKELGRVLASKRSEDRSQNSDKAALKKAGFRRISSRNYYPDKSPDDYKTSVIKNSPTHKTEVTSDKNQTTYAKWNAPLKTRISGRGRKKVVPTSKRVSYLKALKKQLGGTRTERQVHTVFIDSNKFHSKNEPKELISRGKSFKQELKSLPKSLKKAEAKSGDIVVGEPSAAMHLEDPKTGREKRAKLYQKTFGSKLNPKTGFMVGRARKE